MLFNNHSKLSGYHSILSPSRHSWLNYDEEKLEAFYNKERAVERGVRLHALAKDLIELRVKLPNNKLALNRYVNDAIGFRMSPEVVLFYSPNAFGTVDAISFKQNLLRIHDLKTGLSRVSIVQLEIYAAYFCLEYEKDPEDIGIELRIYQENQDVLCKEPKPDLVSEIMEKIVTFDKLISTFRMEE